MGGRYEEGELEEAQLKSDFLVREYEQKTGKKPGCKLNFPGRNPPLIGTSVATDNMFGIYWDKLRKKWYVYRTFDGKKKCGGCFKEDTLEQARRKSDSLVYQHEQKTGEKARNKLNFPGSPQSVKNSEATNETSKRKRSETPEKE